MKKADITISPVRPVTITTGGGESFTVDTLRVKSMVLDFENRRFSGVIGRCHIKDDGSALEASDATFNVEGDEFDTLFTTINARTENFNYISIQWLISTMVGLGHLRVEEFWK